MGDPTKPASRSLTASLCILAALVAASLLRESRPLADPTDTNTVRRQRPFGQPTELVKFADFLDQVELGRRLAPLELSYRLLLYTGDLLSVGQHNLAALAGLETYLVQQLWLRTQKNSTARPLDDSSQPQEADGAVRAPGLLSFFKAANGETRPTSGELTLSTDQRACFNEVRDQGSCGSCYAFSLISLIEWHHCKQFGQLIDFSEQFIIDCGRASKLAGCVEGQLSRAKNFCVHYGLKLEKDWPYTGRERSKLVCGADELKWREIKLSSFQWWTIEVERAVFEQTLKYQPILINLNAPRKFHQYKSGIHSGQSCDKRQAHGAVLVGDGVADGEEFWLIRNSFGANWGEGGYMRMSKRADMAKCFDDAMVSKFMFRSDEAAFENFYDSFEFYPPSKKIVPKSGLTKDLLLSL